MDVCCASYLPLYTMEDITGHVIQALSLYLPSIPLLICGDRLYYHNVCFLHCPKFTHTWRNDPFSFKRAHISLHFVCREQLFHVAYYWKEGTHSHTHTLLSLRINMSFCLLYDIVCVLYEEALSKKLKERGRTRWQNGGCTAHCASLHSRFLFRRTPASLKHFFFMAQAISRTCARMPP